MQSPTDLQIDACEQALAIGVKLQLLLAQCLEIRIGDNPERMIGRRQPGSLQPLYGIAHAIQIASVARIAQRTEQTAFKLATNCTVRIGRQVNRLSFRRRQTHQLRKEQISGMNAFGLAQFKQVLQVGKQPRRLLSIAAQQLIKILADGGKCGRQLAGHIGTEREVAVLHPTQQRFGLAGH